MLDATDVGKFKGVESLRKPAYTDIASVDEVKRYIIALLFCLFESVKMKCHGSCCAVNCSRCYSLTL